LPILQAAPTAAYEVTGHLAGVLVRRVRRDNRNDMEAKAGKLAGRFVQRLDSIFHD
jgi:hypothetical protein